MAHLVFTRIGNTLNLVTCITENFMEKNLAHKNNAITFVMSIVMWQEKNDLKVKFATYFSYTMNEISVLNTGIQILQAQYDLRNNSVPRKHHTAEACTINRLFQVR
jgi:hypothetical protein